MVYAWTDSTIVLNWLDGSPRRFKTYVGNRVSTIISLIPPDRWRDVRSADNPADCAYRGLYPSQLIEHALWWDGPDWLKESKSNWPETQPLPSKHQVGKEEVSLLAHSCAPIHIISNDQFSSYQHLRRITAWILRFIHNTRIKNPTERSKTHLTMPELQLAENYWIKVIQSTHFASDLTSIQDKDTLSKSSSLLPLQPFLDSSNILRVGGRRQLSQTSNYQSRHSVILHGKHQITRLIILDEHQRLLHAGPTLLTASLSRRYHIIGGRQVVRSVTRKCTICRRYTSKPKPQMLGQLPVERITPGTVFVNVGVDYAGPVLIKYGYVRKPVFVKAYILHVCFSLCQSRTSQTRH